MTAMTQLVGGHFQDPEGNLLVNGYLEMALNQDATVPGVCNVAAGITVRIQLDASGSVAAVASTSVGPNQYVWGNDNLSPVNTFYTVTGYTAQGQTAWGPNNQQVKGPSPFDVGTWIPNLVISWVPSTQGVTLETNGTPNIFQNLLNLFAGAGITLTDEGNGTVEISSTSASLALEVNGAPASSQVLQNLVEGSGIVITDEGGGAIQISSGSGSPVVKFMIGAGLISPILPSGAGYYPSVDASLDVMTVRFGFPATLSFNTISFAWNTGEGTTLIAFALYSGAGELLWQSGSLTLAGFSSGNEEISVPSYTLTPGDYYIATTTNGSPGGVEIYGQPLLGVTDGVSNSFNLSQPIIGIAANAATSPPLAFPSTLGVVNGVSAHGNGWSFPYVMFYTL
jgi:hypothetical protein